MFFFEFIYKIVLGMVETRELEVLKFNQKKLSHRRFCVRKFGFQIQHSLFPRKSDLFFLLKIIYLLHHPHPDPNKFVS